MVTKFQRRQYGFYDDFYANFYAGQTLKKF